MSSSASLIYRITADPSAFRAGVGDISSGFDALSAKASAFNQRLSGIGSSLTLGVTAPVVAFGVAVTKSALDMDGLRRGLEAVAGSSAEAENQLRRLKEVAKLPGLGFKDAIEGSIRLQSAGFSAELAERSLKAFGNALATVGKGKADLDGVSLALSQIASKGKISAEEINQLAERVPQIRKAIKDAFGTADTEILQRQGIGSEEFVSRVVAQLERLKTVTGGPKNALENLGDTVQQAAARIGQRLIPAIEAAVPKLEKLADGAVSLVDSFTKLPDPIQNTALAIGGLVIAAGPIASIVGNIGKVAGGVAAFARFAKANPITIPISIIVTSAVRDANDIREELNVDKWNEKAFQAITGRSREVEQSLKSIISTAGGLNFVPSTFQIIADAMRQPTQKAKEFSGTIGAILSTAGIKKTAEDYQAEINKLSKAERELLAQQRQGVDVSKNLAIVRKELADAQRSLAAAMGQATDNQRDTNKITVDSVAETRFEKLNRLVAEGRITIEAARKAQAALNVEQANGARLGDQLSDTSLVYVESLQRVQGATERAKDAVFGFVNASNALGTPLALVATQFDASGEQADLFRLRLAAMSADISRAGTPFSGYADKLADLEARYRAGVTSAAEYQDGLRSIRFELENLNKLPPPKLEVVDESKVLRGSIKETSDILASIGLKSSQQNQQEIRELEAKIDRLRENRRQGTATYDDLAAAEAELSRRQRQAAGVAEDSAKRTGRAYQQVSTIITDLSRSLANTAIDLLFERPKVDVTQYQEKLEDLRQEQEKLIAAQKRGQNVTAQLAAVQAKMAAVTRDMGEAVRRSSLSFRALEAGKTVIADLAKAITRNLIEGAIKKLTDSLLGLNKTSNSVFGGIASAIGGLFGSGSKGASPIFSAVPGVTAVGLENGGLGRLPGLGGGISGASGGGGRAAGAAASTGISATVGLITGAVSAISGVVGNFQMAGINRTLDLIEKEVRYSQIHLLHTLEKANEFWPWMKATHERLYELRAVGIKIENLTELAAALVPAGANLKAAAAQPMVFAGGGGVTIYNDFTGAQFANGFTQAQADAILQKSVARLKTLGLNK